MRARYRPTDSVEFEVEGETQKDIFGELAGLDEVFGEPDCGRCNSTNIYFNVRNSKAKKGKNVGKTFAYYEIVCRECGCFLFIGQHNNGKGTLYPSRYLVDDSGEPIIKDGKKVYDKEYRGWRKSTNRQDPDSED